MIFCKGLFIIIKAKGRRNIKMSEQIFDMSELDAHNEIKEIHKKHRTMKKKYKKYKKKAINVKDEGSEKSVKSDNDKQ